MPPSYPGAWEGTYPGYLELSLQRRRRPPFHPSHKNNNRSPCPFFCSPALLHPSIPSAAWKLLLVLSYNHTCSSLFTYEISICTKCRRCNIFLTAAQQRPAPPRLSLLERHPRIPAGPRPPATLSSWTRDSHLLSKQILASASDRFWPRTRPPPPWAVALDVSHHISPTHHLQLFWFYLDHVFALIAQLSLGTHRLHATSAAISCSAEEVPLLSTRSISTLSPDQP